MPRSLTAADAVIILSFPDVFSAPFQLQGFAADDVFNTDAIDIAETSMGVDGRLSAGYVPREVPQNYMLQADSPSIDRFEQIYAAQVAGRVIFRCTGTIMLRSTEKTYSGSNGVLSNYTPTPAAKKILQPRAFRVTWESLLPAPI